jgi:hypothetical protein
MSARRARGERAHLENCAGCARRTARRRARSRLHVKNLEIHLTTMGAFVNNLWPGGSNRKGGSTISFHKP